MKANIIVIIGLIFFGCVGNGYILGQGTPQDELEIDLKAIYFNHSKDTIQTCVCTNPCVDALDIMQNAFVPIKAPEWVVGEASKPAAYVMGKHIQLYAEFTANQAGIFSIGAKSYKPFLDYDKTKLGDIKKNKVPFTKEGNKFVSGMVPFCVEGTTPDRIARIVQHWKWYVIKDSKEKYFQKTKDIIIYIVLGEAQSPWNEKKLPWVSVLDKVCGWAESEATRPKRPKDIIDPISAMTMVTQRLYDESRGEFTRRPYYSGSRTNRFDLGAFLQAYNNGGVKKVNCFDMGKALVSFSNAIGCDSDYNEIRKIEKFKPTNPIGSRSRLTPKFRVHAVASIKNPQGQDIFFDAALKKWTAAGGEFLTEKTWAKYKKAILSINTIYPASFTFHIANITQKASCIFHRRLENINEIYKLPKNTDYYLKKKIDAIWAKAFKKICKSKKTITSLRPALITNEFERALNEDQTQTVYNTHYLSRSVINKKRAEKLFMKVVEGPNMKSIKKYLLKKYASRPHIKTRTKIDNIGHWCIQLTDYGTSKYVDFIRDNILIMLRVDLRSGSKQFTESTDLVEMAKIINKDINDNMDRIPGEQEDPRIGGERFFIFRNNFSKKRKVLIDVWRPESGEHFYYKIKPDSNGKVIFYRADDRIRIFPNFLEKCSPLSYFFKFSKENWCYRPKCGPTINNNFIVDFHAPTGFKPPVYDQEDPDFNRLDINGGPPTWWLEITVPSILPSNSKSSISSIIDILNEEEPDLEVGEDDQGNSGQ